MRPEFIARVDERVVCNPLSADSLEKISALMLNELVEAMKEKGIAIEFNDSVCGYLAKKADGAKAGARELRSLIRKEIEDILVDMIIDDADGEIKGFAISADEKISVNKI